MSGVDLRFHGKRKSHSITIARVASEASQPYAQTKRLKNRASVNKWRVRVRYFYGTRGSSQPTQSKEQDRSTRSGGYIDPSPKQWGLMLATVQYEGFNNTTGGDCWESRTWFTKNLLRMKSSSACVDSRDLKKKRTRKAYGDGPKSNYTLSWVFMRPTRFPTTPQPHSPSYPITS